MGGGVALFLKEDVDYCLGEDLRIDGIENIWEDAENLIIGVIYNTAYRSQRQFLDEFEQVLHTIYLSKRKCLIQVILALTRFLRALYRKNTLIWSSQRVLIP